MKFAYFISVLFGIIYIVSIWILASYSYKIEKNLMEIRKKEIILKGENSEKSTQQTM